MVWTAAINSSGNEIVITRNSEGIDYRSDSYPLGHLQCRKWVENTRNYLALILLERNEVVITITDDPASPSLGNTLLGSASPVAAYTSFTALSASGSSSSPADAASIETATNTAAANTLAAAANVTLGSILGELSKQKEFEDLLVQDTAGTVFIRREQLEVSTNQRFIAIENFDGTVGAPVGAVTTVKQIKSNSIVTRNYYAKATGTGFAVGDSLATMQIVNGETTAVTLLGWFNITTQASIAAPPTAAIEGYEDLIQELLAQIVAQLPPSLGNKLSVESLSVVLGLDATLPLPTGAATETSLREFIDTLGILTDISIPADELAEATLKGLLRLVAKRLSEAAAQQLAAVGDVAETDALSDPRDFGSLKAALRGQWQDLRGLIGDQATDPATLKALLRELANTLTTGVQYTQVLDANTGNRVQILNSGVAATTEPALVVAVSPTTPVLIGQMPGTMQADLAALTLSAATIATNTANISRYQFNLAETTAGLVFLVRTDGVSGATTTINIATGLAFAPGSIELTDVIPASTAANTKTIEPNEFLAKTNSTGQWAVDDILTRVLIVDTANNTSTTIWQGATGVLLTATPVMGVDVDDTTKTQLNLLKAQPIAGTPITTEALPTGTGLYGWLSYIRSSIAAAITQLTSGNLSTNSIDTKTPSLGQALATGSRPVVLPVAQITALTPPAAITGFALDTSVNSLLKPASTLTGIGTIFNPLPAGTNTIGKVGIDAANIGGLATATNQSSGNTTLASIATNTLVPNIRPLTTSTDSVAVGSLPGTIAADIAAIKANTAKISQYQFTLVEDTVPTVFVARYDTVTGLVANFTLAGLSYTPVGAIKLNDPTTAGGSSKVIEPNEYTAKTNSGANWSIDDILTRILIVDTSTNTVTGTIWQKVDGTILSTLPLLGVDVDDTDKTQLATLKSIVARLPVGAQTTAAALGVSMPKKTLVVGLGMGSGSYSNALDAFTGTPPTDVSAFSGCELTITASGGTLTYTVITAYDSSFFYGAGTADYTSSSNTLVPATGTLAAGTSIKLPIDLTNANYLKLNASNGFGTAGSNCTGIFSQGVPARKQAVIVVDGSNTSTIATVAGTSKQLDLDGKGTATFSLAGTWSGNLQVQLSGDGISWSNLATNNAVYSTVAKGFISNGNLNTNGIYQVNVGSLSSVRLIATSWASGTLTVTARASSASNIVAIEGQPTVSVSNTNLLVRSDSNSTSSDLNGTITTTASSITFNQTWGVSRAAEINVTAIAPGTTYTVEWQEPVGTGWRTVYRFTPITVAGVYRSPLLPNTNANWRYQETIVGATPSVTRSITRTQSNLNVAQAIVPTRTGGFNLINTGFDLPLYGRTRRIVATNRTATLYFLQVHDKATALTTGDVPLAAEVYQLPSTTTLPFTVADLGPDGTLFGINPRLALSTTFNTYTPLTAVAAGQISLFVESI